MPGKEIVGTVAALLIALGGITAGTQGPAPTSGGAESGTQVPTGESITVTGCVVQEAAYARVTAAPALAQRPGDSTREFVIMRPEDDARAGASADRDAGVFSVTGPRESELVPYTGRRVEVTGTVEPARGTAMVTEQPGLTNPAGDPSRVLPPSGASGVHPAGSLAHEPGDALPRTIPDRVADSTATARHVTVPYPDVDALPRLNITGVRLVEGACAPLPTRLATNTEPATAGENTESARAGEPAGRADAAPSVARPAPATVERQEEMSYEFIGCLVRWTPTGAALSPGPGELAVTRVNATRELPGQDSAVPGARPAGRDSGTIPQESPTGTAGGADAAERGFLLDTGGLADVEPLRELVGVHVAVVGTLAGSASSAGDGAASSAAATRGTRTDASGSPEPGGRAEAAAPELAHESAPLERLRVTSFRHVGGHCF